MAGAAEGGGSAEAMVGSTSCAHDNGRLDLLKRAERRAGVARYISLAEFAHAVCEQPLEIINTLKAAIFLTMQPVPPAADVLSTANAPVSAPMPTLTRLCCRRWYGRRRG